MSRQALSKWNLAGAATVVTAVAIIAGCASAKFERVNSPPPRDNNPFARKVRPDVIRHNYKVGEIKSLCEAGLTRLNTRLASEVKTAFDLDWVLADTSDEIGVLVFMAYVHTDEKVREEASTCEEKYNTALVDVFTRRNLYEAVKTTKGESASGERLVGELKRAFEKNGMALSDSDLAKLKELRSKVGSLEAQFSKNLNEDASFILATKAELEGISEDFVKRLEQKGDKLIVTTKNVDFLQVMENAKNPEVRKRMLQAYDNRAAGNTALLEEATDLRRQIAKLMKYATWADYQTDGRMAQNAAKPLAMIQDLKVRLRPRLEADLAILLKAKQELEDPNATKLMAWDARYFPVQVQKRDYAIDDEVIREYFPKDTVMAGLFDLYSTLFHVKFEEVRDGSVWTPDVKMYSIREKKDDVIIGYFYTDFIPRKGKYGHAAAFPLIAGRMMKAGHYSQPVASIVANFTPPANGKPSLLNHKEVETLFHEFGHIMHQTLTSAPYAYLSGSSTSRDFVEAPSQVLENWVWDEDILNRISGHYTDVNRKLPVELVKKMLAAKDFNQGYFYSRQIMLGLTDLEIHMTEGPVDVTAVYNRVHEETLLFPTVEGSHFMASFGHMMGGYDAGYYGYIWSEVFAADMFTRFKTDGLRSEKAGRDYRDTILAQGAMEEPSELLKRFLGRESNNKAFLESLGLTQ